MSGFVMFCGSRSLPSGSVPLVQRVVGAVLRSGRGVVVGCAAGADAAVVSQVLALGGASRLTVLAAARLGLPVFVFPVGALSGIEASALPLLPSAVGGAWSPAGNGVWAEAWRWCAAQQALI